MGLQNQLNDVSSDSIPLLLLALIATCVNHILSSLSFLLGICRFHHTSGQSQNHAPHIDDGFSRAIGSPLAGLVVLAEQLNLNRLLSDRFSSCDSSEHSASDCVVCLCAFGDGDHVRRLSCHHVFHKNCFDGWLDHMNFSCPLCRTPLVSTELVDLTGQRVGRELVEFYSIRSGA